MKRTLLIIVCVAIIATGGILVYAVTRDAAKSASTSTSKEKETPKNGGASVPPEQPAPASPVPAFTFTPPKKSAHYVSNTPAHEAILDNAPSEVSITFNFDLSTKSTISVVKDGQEVGAGPATVSADKLVLTKALTPGSGKGLYTVTYDACWPDGSCHDGRFQFGVKQ